jgi:hypothetical protein
MAPRLASGDGPVALPLDGQFQSCRPWRAEALETGVRDLPVEGRTMKNRRQGLTRCGAITDSIREARCSWAGTGRAPPMT